MTGEPRAGQRDRTESVDTSAVVHHNLPLPTVKLVERPTELAAVVELIRRPEVRLLTLVGPPGIGKTQVALTAAEVLLAEFPDGVYFVDLQPIQDPRLVGVTIAQALGISDMGNRRIEDTLREVLAERQVLLVLDNFEQLLPAGPQVVSLLASCPRTNALVTSRAPLHVSIEHQFLVPPLGVPDFRQQLPVEQLAAIPSVALFALRAAAVQPRWTLNQENAASVAELCARLDGLPLAIELAAGWMKLLPPKELVPRLDHGLDVLVAGNNDWPERHQTMRTAIAWSYGLLDQSEQRLYRRLAVFVGGWTIEAATDVCRLAVDLPTDLLPLLRALVDKNLITVNSGGEGELRFGMLRTLREFALEQLTDVGELDLARRRHSHFFVCLGERADEALDSPSQVAWLERLQQDYDNLRAALDWCTTSSEPEALELGLRLGASLWLFWDVRGHTEEGRQRLRDLLELPEAQAHTPLRARALQAAGWMAYVQANTADGMTVLDEAVSLARESGDQAVLARSLATRGVILGLNTGEAVRAELLLEEALALGRALGDTWTIGFALFTLGRIAMERGDLRQAEQHLQDVLTIVRSSRNIWAIACTLYSLGFVAIVGGDSARAVALERESLSLNQTIGNTRCMALCVELLAALAVNGKDIARATRLFAIGEELCGAANYSLPPSLSAWHARGLDTARAVLGSEAFAECWADGKRMTANEAVSFAMATGTAVSIAREKLTLREREIVRSVAQGLTDRQVATRLGISPRTVDNHLRHIFAKLGISSRTALAVWAVRFPSLVS